MNDMVQEPGTGDSTSGSLLQRAKQRDPAAWERLAAVYTPLVFQWCCRAGLQSSDADDIVQEVFRSVATSLDRFRKQKPGDSFRGWLWTITRNKVNDHFRTKPLQPLGACGTAAGISLHELPDRAWEEVDGESDSRLRSHLAQRAVALMKSDFAPKTWHAFWLSAIDGQPASQVSEELGMSTTSVYVAKSRVLRRLREEFDGLDLLE